MKKIVVIIVNFLCLTLLSLSDTQYKMKGNTVRDESYNFEIATYTDYKENDIYIEFPQINGLQNRNNERKINESIKNTVLKDLVYNSKKLYPELQLITTMKCQVTLHTDEIFSFVLLGTSYIETGMHPNYGVYSMTFNITNGLQLELSDFVDINEEFIKNIKNAKRATTIPMMEGVATATNEQLMDLINSKDDDMLLKAFKEKWGGYMFYITPDSLVVSVPTYHAADDFALVELSSK